MNGENWGIMNIEESFTKELLEKQEAKESIIIRFPNLFNKSIWSYRNLNNSEPYPWYRILDDDFNIHLYNDTKYLENLIYRKYFSFIQEKAIISSSEIYDLKKISEVFLFLCFFKFLLCDKINDLLGKQLGLFCRNPLGTERRPRPTIWYHLHPQIPASNHLR